MKPLIERDLCTRCGACFAADERRILEKDSNGFPQHNSCDESYINSLLKVCSGENWNYKELIGQTYGPTTAYDPNRPDVGTYRSIHLLSSTDKKLRYRGQSGGVTTTLLRFAMIQGIIDAVLAVRRPSAENGNPYSAEPYIARSPDELMASCGSKYTICSTLEKVQEISEESEKFAITSLPCQTVGLRRLMSSDGSNIRNRCKLIIGPFCGLNMEKEVGEALAKASQIENDSVKRFDNRQGVFPGQTTFELTNGEKKIVDRTAHRILYRMYTPLRCYTCTDYGNELADLSVADCWLGTRAGGYKYPEGAAYVICRSERGEDLVKKAVENGQLISHNFSEQLALENWKPSFYHRKVRAHNRIRYWKKRGQRTPVTDYQMPNPFPKSQLADSVEMGLWRAFRVKAFRHFALRLWLNLAKAPDNSFRKLIFDECKHYLFTHRYDQWNRLSAQQSWKRTMGLVKIKAGKTFPKPAKRKMKKVKNILRRWKQILTGKPIVRDYHLEVSKGMKKAFRSWDSYNEKWDGEPKILMASGHGYGNVGDEAQCGACINRWKRVAPNCRITLFSPHPPYTEALHKQRCEWAPRVAWFRSNTIGPYDGDSNQFEKHFKNLKWRLEFSAKMMRRGIPLTLCNPRESSILKVLQEHDYLHISGGGFLTGKTRSRLHENCLLMRICQILEIPYILTGHNIGVFQNENDRKLAKLGLRNARHIGLRDQGLSSQELASIGIAGTHVVSNCDDALLCERADQNLTMEFLKSHGLESKLPWATANFHHWGQEPSEQDAIEQQFALMCDYIVEKHKFQLVFVSMTPGDVQPELNVIQRMKQPAMMAPYSPDYKVVRGVIADSQLCFTMKHHPIVFAQGESVPVVSIALDDYYYRKNKGALENTGHGNYMTDKNSFLSGRVTHLIDQAVMNAPQIKKEMNSWVSKMRRLELSPYEQLLND